MHGGPKIVTRSASAACGQLPGLVCTPSATLSDAPAMHHSSYPTQSSHLIPMFPCHATQADLIRTNAVQQHLEVVNSVELVVWIFINRVLYPLRAILSLLDDSEKYTQAPNYSLCLQSCGKSSKPLIITARGKTCTQPKPITLVVW
eukprot:2738011-Amphidinium_carterae.1